MPSIQMVLYTPPDQNPIPIQVGSIVMVQKRLDGDGLLVSVDGESIPVADLLMFSIREQEETPDVLEKALEQLTINKERNYKATIPLLRQYLQSLETGSPDGNLLKQARGNLNLTQRQLAMVLGCNFQVLGREWERKNGRPNGVCVAKIIGLLDSLEKNTE